MRPEINQKARRLLIAGSLVAVLLPGCRHDYTPAVERDGSDSLTLQSSSLQSDQFPPALTCDGANSSPELHWDAPIAGVRSFALILYDRDAPRGGFVLWVLFNLPPQSRALSASFPTQAELPDGAHQGTNDFDKIGYGGPCPDGTHHYVFMLFALDTMLNLPPGATRAQLDNAMLGHILAHGTLTAIYSR